MKIIFISGLILVGNLFAQTQGIDRVDLMRSVVTQTIEKFDEDRSISVFDIIEIAKKLNFECKSKEAYDSIAEKVSSFILSKTKLERTQKAVKAFNKKVNLDKRQLRILGLYLADVQDSLNNLSNLYRGLYSTLALESTLRRCDS